MLHSRIELSILVWIFDMIAIALWWLHGHSNVSIDKAIVQPMILLEWRLELMPKSPDSVKMKMKINKWINKCWFMSLLPKNSLFESHVSLARTHTQRDKWKLSDKSLLNCLNWSLLKLAKTHLGKHFSGTSHWKNASGSLHFFRVCLNDVTLFNWTLTILSGFLMTKIYCEPSIFIFKKMTFRKMLWLHSVFEGQKIVNYRRRNEWETYALWIWMHDTH